MISFDEAAAIAAAAARPLGAEPVRLGEAAGRTLARSVAARIDSPRFEVSSMDGYAARDADLGAPSTALRIIGQSLPGAGFSRRLGRGECVRIFTGAPVPAGADRVVIQELVSRDGDLIHLQTSPSGSRFVRLQGSDFRAGDVLVQAGRKLDAQALVAVAAADVAEVEVFRRPRVMVLATGDELTEPGTAAQTAQAIPESVSPGIAAMVQDWGGTVLGVRRLRDDLAGLERAAGEALEGADLVVVTGGASIGERDFAKAMFAPHGLRLMFSKVGIKPGKPVWLGRAGPRLVLGLPGNPTSAMVTARLFLAPLLAGLGGRSPSHALLWREAALSAPLPMTGERETFHRAAARGESVQVLEDQDSGAQRALAAADVLIRTPPHAPALDADETVRIVDF